MIYIRFIIPLFLISNVLLAQQKLEAQQFEPLNQFLNVRDFSLSADGTEAFFTMQSPGQEISQLGSIKKENNQWLAPQLLPFSDEFMYMEPFLSANGNRLYFVSDRPLDDKTNTKKDFDIWYVDRKNKFDPWSSPKNMGKPINTELDEFYPSVADNNNLYYTMVGPTGMGKDDIYFSQWENGSYLPPVLLDENINSSGYEFNAFVSKKEDFILFTKYNEKDGQGSGDLYISKKDINGKWSKSTNLGLPINTKYMEYCPFYDEKNQLLYFTSKRNTIATRKFSNVSEFKKYVQESNNGLSKIYVIPLKIE
jgi:hypothetical protein